MTPAPTSRQPGPNVHPATVDRFDDVATLLAPRRSDAPACWCLTYRLTSSENSALTAQQRPELLRRLCARDPAPGVVAYLNGEPVGWCAVGPRAEMERLERSRTIPRVDDRPVWSVICFVVRTGYRRRGIAHALLAGAVGHARASGAVVIEGYPVDTGGSRISGTLAYVGTTNLFAGAGFDRVLETAARSAGLRRWVMRRELT